LLICGLAGCKGSTADSEKSSAKICTSSPYLQAAMNDLLGMNNEVSSMLSLAGAGMCPGHMDLRPSQIQMAGKSQVFIRFDFQSGLDDKLFTSLKSRPKVKPINVEGGLCNPQSYINVCSQITNILINEKYSSKIEIKERFSEIRLRLVDLDRDIHKQISTSELVKHPILTSPHQADFCRYLGFNVLETFTSEEDMSVKQIDNLVTKARNAGVSLIVANAPEGRKMADVLASYLGARVVVLDNFPDAQTVNAFDVLVRENVRRLMEK
jgi:ABC-type Zn uptake system ZnuABC Zn-binding protein ZnuA